MHQMKLRILNAAGLDICNVPVKSICLPLALIGRRMIFLLQTQFSCLFLLKGQLTLCLMGTFHAFLSSPDFFFKLLLFIKVSQEHIRVSNNLDPDQARRFVGPNLNQNCLQRLSADASCRNRVKAIYLFHLQKWTNLVCSLSVLSGIVAAGRFS